MAAFTAAEIEALLRLRDDMSPSLKIAANNLTAAGNQMKSVGASLLPLSLGIAAVGIGAVKMATDLNATLANVSALLTDLSGPELDQVTGSMKLKVQDLAMSMGKSTTDISGGLYEVISSLGYTNDTFAQLEISAKAGAAGLATTQESFQFLSAVTKAYGDTSAEAFDKVADLGFQAVNFGQTTFPELAASIGGVAPIAKVAGISLEEMFAVIATATGVTGNTAEVTTQMASAINALLNPSKDLKEMYKQLGIEGGEAMIAQFGFAGSLQQIAAYAEQTKTPMMELLGRKEAFILTATLAGSQAGTFAQRLIDMAAAADASSSVLNAAFEKQTQGINAAGFAWEQFKSQLMVAAQRLGDAMLPALAAIGTLLRPVINWVMQLTLEFSKIPLPVQMVVVVLGLFLAALGPLLLALGTMASMSGLFASGLAIMTGALSTSTAATWLGVTAITVYEAAQARLAIGMGVLNGWALKIGPALGMLTGYTAANAAATNVATGASNLWTAAKARLAAAAAFLGNNVVVATVKTWAHQVSMLAASAAQGVAAATGLTLAGVMGVLAVAAAAVAVAFIAWKVGEWIGGLKLFEGGTVSVTDKLGMMFARMMGGQGAVDAYRANMNAGAEATNRMAKAVENAKNQFDQGTQAVADLEAKMELLNTKGGLSQAMLKEIAQEAQRLKDSGQQLSPALENVIRGLKIMEENAKPIPAVFNAATKSGEDLANAIADLSGATAQGDMNLLAMAVEAVGGAAGMTESKAAELTDQIAKLVAEGAKLPQVLKDFIEGRVAKAFEQAAKDFEELRKEMEVDEALAQIKRQWEEVDRAAEEAGVTQVSALEMAIAMARQAMLDNIARLEMDYRVIEALAAQGKATQEAAAAAKKAWEEARAEFAGVAEEQRDAGQATLDYVNENRRAFGQMADIFRELGGEFDGMAGSILTGLADIVDGFLAGAKGAEDFANAQSLAGKGAAVMNVAMTAYRGNALSGAAAGAAFGSSFGPIGTAIGAVAGGLLGFIGSSRRAREEARLLAEQINKARMSFIESQGGLRVLELAAAEAGVSLQAMWNARTVEEYEAAVRDVEAAIRLTEEATGLTKEAMDRWGLTAADMGPKFREGMLHEQLLEIYQDFALLEAAGADAARILGDPADPESMAANMNTLVQTALATGVALPETMRPMIERMIELGLLFDESGKKIESIDQIPFTETLQASVQKLVDKIMDLIAAMTGIPNIDREVNIAYKVTGQQGGPGEPPPPDPPMEFMAGGLHDFGRGTPAMLHGEEAVVPMSGRGAFASGFAKMLGAEAAKAIAAAGGGGGETVVHAHLYMDGQRVLDQVIRAKRAGVPGL